MLLFITYTVTVEQDDRWFNWLLDIFKIYEISSNKHFDYHWFHKFIAFLPWSAILPILKLLFITAGKLDLKIRDYYRCSITNQIYFIKIFNAEGILILYKGQYLFFCYSIKSRWIRLTTFKFQVFYRNCGLIINTIKSIETTCKLA